VTSEVVTLRVEKEGLTDLTLVDLPGLISGADTPERQRLQDDIKALVSSYVEDDQV
jgi:hypothetical protein